MGHINVLKTYLSKYPSINYIPIVVFLSKSDIKVKTTHDIINSRQLIHTIKKYNEINIEKREKEDIYKIINDANLVDTYDKTEHIKSIKKLIQRRKSDIQDNKCPQCGGRLVLRNGEYGEFLGCTSYPRCKFINKI
ncbi:topoisomerase DNA-binding C4 zinc finger domain-containing protein [Flavobacterium sp.]|uniref:topoisomerase DNA-binding C4 zinc finger domain-containing protein n=1 Tax=Flavobacterium sp. TaxID=239 RepID=UPI0026A22DF6